MNNGRLTIKEFVDTIVVPAIDSLCQKYKTGKTVMKHIGKLVAYWNTVICCFYSPNFECAYNYRLKYSHTKYKGLWQGRVISIALYRVDGGVETYLLDRTFHCAN